MNGDTVICVVDGREEIRACSHMEIEQWRGRPMPRQVPVLQSDERVEYVVGDHRPYIFKTP